MDVGASFKQSTYLEVRNPDNLPEQAIHTQVSFYANVSRHSRADDRAFLMYMGNEEGTHTKMPHTSKDDYLAIEVVEGGKAKLTIDLGAGPRQIESNKPIPYDQWIFIEVNRRGHYVTLSVSSEQSPGEEETDTVTDQLDRYDEYNRPFGSVFNMHPEFSRIFVGGFPNTANIQDTVRETSMEGQIEGLKIGGKSVGLFNYKSANNLEGAPGRNKFKEKPETRVRFNGNGYLALDRDNYGDVDEELVVDLKFKPESTDGLLFLAGNADEGDFVALELRNQFLVYR